MSRREERRELEENLLKARERLDGDLAKAEELELPPPPPRPRPSAPLTGPIASMPAKRGPGRPRKTETSQLSTTKANAAARARLAALDAQRPRAPSPEPETTEVEDDLPAAPPPPPIPSTPSPRAKMSQKDPSAAKYHNEPPHELMTKHIDEGYGPIVWAEIRRLLPGGSGTSTLRRNISIPIQTWSFLAEKASLLLFGGGAFIIRLSQERGGAAFISWKESFEGPAKVSDPGLTLCYDDDRQDFITIQSGIEALGGVPFAGSSPPNPYAASLPPMPAGGGAPGSYARPTVGPDGRLQPPPESLTQPWMRTYPAEQQWNFARQLHPEIALAREWVGERGRDVEQARTQAARYEERLDATRDRSQGLLESERQARQALERQLAEMRGQNIAREAQAAAEKRETELRNEMKLLELKIGQGGTSSSAGVAAYAPLVTALAPVLSAFLTSQAEMRAAEQRSRDDFQRQLLLMQQAPKNQPDPLAQIVPLIAAVAPLVAPVLASWMENRDPMKLAEVQQMMAQNSMMQNKFIFDALAQLHGGNEGEPEPWYVKFFRELIPSVAPVAQGLMLEAGRRAEQNARELPRQDPRVQVQPAPPPPPRPGETQVLRPEDVPAHAQPEPVAPPPPVTSFALDIARTVETFGQADPVAAQYLGMILDHLSRTPGAEAFLRHEWATILFHLHVVPKNEKDLDERAYNTAFMLADLLEHDRTFALLPEALRLVFTEPRAALMGIIQALPCWNLLGEANTVMSKRFVDLAVEEIQDREKARIEAENEDDEDDDEEETEDEDDADEAEKPAEEGAEASEPAPKSGLTLVTA